MQALDYIPAAREGILVAIGMVASVVSCVSVRGRRFARMFVVLTAETPLLFSYENDRPTQKAVSASTL